MTFLLGVLAISANAAVFVVDNGTLSGTKYKQVDAAIADANKGDTIYITGSATTYNSFTLDKRLVIIGAGYKASGTQYNWPTTVGDITFSDSYTATGSTIKGIKCGYIFARTNGVLSNNVTIERMYIASDLSIGGDNWIVKNNIIGSISVFGTYNGYNRMNNNVTISNNIITTSGSIRYSDKPSVIITNNIFFPGFYMGNVSYAVVANNIMINPGISNFSGGQNTYNKNLLVYSAETDYKTFPPAGNTGGDNQNTVDAIFTQKIPIASISSPTDYTWMLKSTAVGKNWGTDGTDVGIYGGSYPMPNLNGVINIPQIVSFNILNSVIPANGTLNIELKAKANK